MKTLRTKLFLNKNRLANLNDQSLKFTLGRGETEATCSNCEGNCVNQTEGGSCNITQCNCTNVDCPSQFCPPGTDTCDANCTGYCGGTNFCTVNPELGTCFLYPR